MSAETLYQAIQNGHVKLTDLNDDGKTALKDYMFQKYPVQGPADISGPLQGPPNLSDTEQGPPDLSTHETFLQNPLPVIGHKILGLLGLPEDSTSNAINRFSSSLDASLTPKGPDITSDPNKSLFQNIASAPQYAEGPTSYDQAAQRVQQYDTGSPFLNKTADVAGEMASFLAPLPGMNPILNDAYAGVNALTKGTRLGAAAEQKIGQFGQNVADRLNPLLNTYGTNIGPELAQKLATHAAQGATAGALYGATQPFVSGYGQMSEVPGSVAENALMFGAGDAAFPLAGAAIKPLITKLSDRAALNSAAKDFISRTNGPETPYNLPNDINLPSLTDSVRAREPQILPAADAAYGDQLAGNLRRGEQYQQEYDQAIKGQQDYLKQSLNNRGGVDQGGVIKDPVTGEVIDRYGRISNNPKWFQDFYAENGRVPNQKDLESLAKKQIDNGYQEDIAQVPSFRPKELDEIDQQLAEINNAMPHVDAETRQSLTETANILQTERERLAKLMPQKNKPKTFDGASPRTDNLVLYRGQPKGYNNLQKVDQSDIIDNILIGKGIFTTTDKDMARTYGENLFSFDGPKDRARVLDLSNADETTLRRIMPQTFFTRKMYGKTGYEFYREFLKNGSIRDAEDMLFESMAERYLPDGVTWNEVKNGGTAVSGKGPLIDDVRSMLSDALQKSGFDFIKHKGGIRAGKGAKEHDVYIALHDKALNRIPELMPEAPKSTYQEQPQPMKANETKAYAGNSFPFRQAQLQTERTISRNEVINNLRKNLNMTIGTGRLSIKGNGVLGEFKVKPEVIRSRMQGDIQVISHEVGHNLDKRFKLSDPRYAQELVNMVNQVNPGHLGNYQPHQHLEEAIAEYVRSRLTNPAQAKQMAPNFTRFFESQLDKKALQGLEASAKDIDTWITQGDYEQAKGLIDFTSGSRKEPFDPNKWYTRYVDDLNPLKLAEKALKGFVGLGSDSIYKMARLSRGIAEKAKLAVTRGVYDARGNKVSDGLAEIVKPLEDMGIKEKDFATYLAVKHAIDLKAMGKRVPFSDEQIQAVMRKLDTPEVQAFQQKIIGYNNKMLDILVEAQVLSQQAVNEMRKKYPNYVPFMRYFDDDAIAGFKNGGFGAAKGFANITNPIKRMSEEGSLKDLINPIESMVKNTFLVMNAAAKNKVGLQLADLAKIDGAGAWVEHVGEGGASPHEHIVSVYENGVRQSYQVRDPELYNAMLSLDNESTNSLIKFLGGTASLLRAGATLTPEFMIRNAMRDVAGAMVNSTKYGFNPIDWFKGMFHVLNKTKEFDQFLSSGGAMGTLMALDRDANREALKSVFRESLKDKTLNVVTSPKELAKMLSLYTPVKSAVEVLRKGAEISELSTKTGAFLKTLRKTGSLEESAYTARDLMDFNRAGSSIRQANRAVAFLNASIQGTDKMLRAYKDNKASFLVRSFTTLALPSIGLYYWNQNLPDDMKKEYNNIPQWQKDSFFIVGIPGVGFARIPKPFEAGMLFATGTDRIMRWYQDNDPQAFKEYGSSLLETFTPPMLFTALTPLLEAITNHSFFRDAPIVPVGEARLEKKDQYGLFTSEVAKGIGSLVSKTPLRDTNMASPRIIDNTIKGYTAGLGQYAIDGLDAGIRAVSGKEQTPLPEKKLIEKPLIRSFFASTAGGGQVRQDFYDKWDELSNAKNSADRNQEAYTNPDYFRMKSAKSVIDNFTKQYKKIQADKFLLPDVKRQKLDDLDSKMNDMAAKGLGGK